MFNYFFGRAKNENEARFKKKLPLITINYTLKLVDNLWQEIITITCPPETFKEIQTNHNYFENNYIMHNFHADIINSDGTLANHIGEGETKLIDLAKSINVGRHFITITKQSIETIFNELKNIINSVKFEAPYESECNNYLPSDFPILITDDNNF